MATLTRAKVLPCTNPPFTVGDLRKAIPPHCFKQSLLKSFSYVLYDFAVLCSLYYVASNYFNLLPQPLSYVAWPLYWLGQSFVFAAIWVLAHECGNHAFSEYPWLDDTVGMILHTSLLVPYFSWRISHRKHHSNTGSLEYEEVFVPKRKAQMPAFFKYLDNPVGRTLKIVVVFTFTWHWYLLFNFYGRNYSKFASHNNPYSPIFSDKERPLVWISNAGILAFIYALYSFATVKGFPWLVFHYVIPFIMLKSWLVMVTFLQHTHPALPRYDSSDWDWLRGALSTVDRDYGLGVVNHIFHNINNTHVLHHLFSIIPHYHAIEATNAIKPILGEYYNFDGTPFMKSVWREFKECIYVEADQSTKNKGVYWFNKEL